MMVLVKLRKIKFLPKKTHFTPTYIPIQICLKKLARRSFTKLKLKSFKNPCDEIGNKNYHYSS